MVAPDRHGRGRSGGRQARRARRKEGVGESHPAFASGATPWPAPSPPHSTIRTPVGHTAIPLIAMGDVLRREASPSVGPESICISNIVCIVSVLCISHGVARVPLADRSSQRAPPPPSCFRLARAARRSTGNIFIFTVYFFRESSHGDVKPHDARAAAVQPSMYAELCRSFSLHGRTDAAVEGWYHRAGRRACGPAILRFASPREPHPRRCPALFPPP